MAEVLYERKSQNYLGGFKRVSLFADGSFFLDDEKHLLDETRLHQLLSFLAGNEEFLTLFDAKKILRGERGAALFLVHKHFVIPETALDAKRKDFFFVAATNEKDSEKWRLYTIARQVEGILFSTLR